MFPPKLKLMIFLGSGLFLFLAITFLEWSDRRALRPPTVRRGTFKEKVLTLGLLFGLICVPWMKIFGLIPAVQETPFYLW